MLLNQEIVLLKLKCLSETDSPDKESEDSICYSLHGSEKESTTNSKEYAQSDNCKNILSDLRVKNVNRIIIGQINMNSLCNKFIQVYLH